MDLSLSRRWAAVAAFTATMILGTIADAQRVVPPEPIGPLRIPMPVPAPRRTDGPELRRRGSAAQLYVQGRPYLVLGGELHNSSASSLEYMEPIWDRLVAMNLNTALAVVSWELIEPEENRFDFALVDGLIGKAREHNLKLVLLWFGSWKNGVSSYVPGWVKTDVKRFPRVQRRNGQNIEVLTPLSAANANADAKAFAALMRHIRDVDQRQQTVIMMQVENEAGLLGDSRDRSPAAEAMFGRSVPPELTRHFVDHRDQLIPEFKAHWEKAGLRTSGDWTAVFGEGADEAFMAWHMAHYIGSVAAAGKRQYDIPMYANAWLIQNEGQKAGGYPSGGPVSKVMDIWRAAAPEIDFLAPDIYLPDFKGVCASYLRNGNPLFIPEAGRGPDAAGKAFYAFGQCSAIGFCPFGIDSLPPDHPLKDAYGVLAQIAPLVLKCQGTEQILGILQDRAEMEGQRVEMAGYDLEIGFNVPGKSGGMSYGIVIAMANDDFLVAGSGLGIHFAARTPGPKNTGILSIDDGRFVNGKWVPGRRMNGDESAGGWRLRLPAGAPGTQRIRLYRFE